MNEAIKEGGETVVFDILMASVYLLRCPTEFDTRSSTITLLRDLAESTHDLLHIYFMDILSFITKSKRYLSVTAFLNEKTEEIDMDCHSAH